MAGNVIRITQPGGGIWDSIGDIAQAVGKGIQDYNAAKSLESDDEDGSIAGMLKGNFSNPTNFGEEWKPQTSFGFQDVLGTQSPMRQFGFSQPKPFSTGWEHMFSDSSSLGSKLGG